ncbi:MAG: hypothetical protein WBE13_23090 [Candidatus Acidiferrum sp.]
MSYKRKTILGIAFLAALSVGSAQVRAQQTQQTQQTQQDTEDKPKPAGRDYAPPPEENGQQNQNGDQSGVELQPDNQPLGGIAAPSLGTPELRHSYWVPGLEYGNAISSNSPSIVANSGWNSTNYFLGTLIILELSGHSVFGVNYSGGGTLSTGGGAVDGQMHQLSTGYSLNSGRWQILLLDQFSYLPESGFGFGGGTALAIPGVQGILGASLPGMQAGFLPNQSILSATGQQISNTGAAQATYLVSRRSSITVNATYGLLRYVNSSNFDSNNPTAGIGYSYELTRNDSIGVQYRFGSFQFPGNPQAIGIQVGQLEYGRKITGQLSVQLFGGPEYTAVRVPVSGQSNRLVGSGGATLLYGWRRSQLSLIYNSGVTAGSGIFTGANTNMVTASLGRSLTRIWQGSIDGGFAKNAALLNYTAQTPIHYTSWFAGAGVSRPFGRDTTLSLGYRAEIEDTNGTVCSVPACGSSYLQHSIWLSFQWHSRPLVIE